jgi:hypothetical protein
MLQYASFFRASGVVGGRLGLGMKGLNCRSAERSTRDHCQSDGDMPIHGVLSVWFLYLASTRKELGYGSRLQRHRRRRAHPVRIQLFGFCILRLSNRALRHAIRVTDVFKLCACQISGDHGSVRRRSGALSSSRDERHTEGCCKFCNDRRRRDHGFSYARANGHELQITCSCRTRSGSGRLVSRDAGVKVHARRDELYRPRLRRVRTARGGA